MTMSSRSSSDLLRDLFRESAMTPAFVLETSAFFLFLPFLPFLGPATGSGTGEGASDKGEDILEGDGLLVLPEAVGVPSLGTWSAI